MAHSKLAVALLVCAAILVGCKKEQAKARLCPPLQSYSAQFLSKLGGELEEIIADKKYPNVQKVVADYGLARDDIRACMKHR